MLICERAVVKDQDFQTGDLIQGPKIKIKSGEAQIDLGESWTDLKPDQKLDRLGRQVVIVA